MIIAIDGLGVNGKSTLAEKISNELKFKNFNTGAIYRCIALEIINKNLDIENINETITKLRNINIDFINKQVLLNGKDVTGEIRTEQISIKSTQWATIIEIKKLVRAIQKDFLEKYNTVIEGRDICTRIAPNADVKFYLYSDFETRVRRLWKQNRNIDIETIRNNLNKRDDLDINGGNFIKPVDAIEIDTTNLSINEVYNLMMKEIKCRINKLEENKNDIEK